MDAFLENEGFVFTSFEDVYCLDLPFKDKYSLDSFVEEFFKDNVLNYHLKVLFDFKQY